MGDGRVDRAKARTSEITARVPELKERVPELKERVPDLRSRGTELRSRGSELRSELARQYGRMDVRWARCAPVRALREGLMSFGLGPLIDLYTMPRVHGLERFDDLQHPVIFVANHASHLDTPTILRAMPLKWRQRTAVAAAADYFYKSRLTAYGVAVLLNTVPLARKGGGLGNGATDHVDRLIDERWNLLMFPEGTRSRDGSIGKLRSGAAVLAAQHGIPIVPIHVSGTHAAMPPGHNWPKRRRGRLLSHRHAVDVRFGVPIWPGEEEHRSEVMGRVHAFFLGEDGSVPERASVLTPGRLAQDPGAEVLAAPSFPPDVAALPKAPDGAEPAVAAPVRSGRFAVAPRRDTEPAAQP